MKEQKKKGSERPSVCQSVSPSSVSERVLAFFISCLSFIRSFIHPFHLSFSLSIASVLLFYSSSSSSSSLPATLLRDPVLARLTRAHLPLLLTAVFIPHPMHTGYFTSWPPRVDTLDALGDLHQPRKSPSLLKKSTAPVSASAPSSPRAEPSRSRQGTAFDASFPSSPTPPQRTATAPTPHRRSSGPRMTSRALSADSINMDALGFRNAIAGGLLTSPSGVPTNSYLPYLPSMIPSTPSTSFDHPSNSSTSSATSPSKTTNVITGGAAAAATGGSTHMISFGAPYALYRTPSGGRPPMVRSNSSKKREAQQRASYHPSGGMNGSQPPRKSSSFADPGGASSGTGVGTGTGTGTANRQGGGTSTEFNHGGQWFQSSNLRKSVSAGKPAKKGLKSRLRKLRHRQGSSSRDGPIAFTSGESDSEAAFGKSG